MSASNDLFRLIKSLSPSEKRFFKIYSSRHVIGEENNYVKLFDIIDKQKQYDEAEIRKHFNNNPFVKYLSKSKAYLHQLILKSLTSYYSQITIDAKLKEQLRQVEILYHKALYDQCIKLLRKVKKFILPDRLS